MYEEEKWFREFLKRINEHIGNLLKNNGNLSTEECDKIIKEVAYE